MVKVSTIGRLVFHVNNSRKVALGLAAILAALLATGCSKSKAPVVQAAVDQNTNQVAPGQVPVSQQPVSAGSAAVAVQPPAPPDLKDLDRSLLRWILANRRRPQNFEEFAATANVAIPAPPAGKKYVLGKDMHIQLVNR